MASRVASATDVAPCVRLPGASSTPSGSRCRAISSPRGSDPMLVRRLDRVPEPGQAEGDVGRAAARVLGHGPVGAAHDVDERLAEDQRASAAHEVVAVPLGVLPEYTGL